MRLAWIAAEIAAGLLPYITMSQTSLAVGPEFMHPASAHATAHADTAIFAFIAFLLCY
jgi:hypothetical protein